MKASDKDASARESGYTYFTDLSTQLFSNWRMYRMLSGVFGALAIIPAMIDYELGYKQAERNAETCVQNEVSQVYRLATAALSILAIIMLIPYKVYYYNWLKNLPMTYKEYTPYNRVSVLEVMEMQRKRKIKDYLLEGSLWVVILLYLIFPYPTDTSTFVLPQQIYYVQVNVCYFTSELFFAIMFFRLAFLVLALFSYGMYQTDLARKEAEKYSVVVSASFSIKCYIGANPLPILVFCFLIPGVVIFGLLMRIFDRPMEHQDFDSAENAFWNIIITMTTVGYGDTFAQSILGRTMVVLSIFWGGIILSLTFVTVGSVLQLKPNERKAYNAITVGRGAASAIGSALATSKHDSKNKNAWASIRAKLRAFIVQKSSDSNNETFIHHSTNIVNGKLNLIENRAERIREKLNKLSASLD